jgi:branched-chain amino acid transport system permease protein
MMEHLNIGRYANRDVNTWLLVLVGLAAVGFPLLADTGLTYEGVIILSYIVFAVSFNFVYGYMGEVPLGHAVFFGLGAYAAAIVISKTGAPYPVAVAASFFVPLVFALLFGWFASRLTAVYFSIFSLAFGEAIRGVVHSWDNLTAGTLGLYYTVPGYLQSPTVYYYYVLVVSVGSLLILRRMVNSPFGMVLKSIRENERRAESLGVNPKVIKVLNLTIAGGFAGLAGSSFGPAVSVLYPNIVGWQTGAIPLWSTLVGGSTVFVGPIIGAVLYESMRTWAISVTEHWPIIEGTILLLILLYNPTGIAGYLSDRLDASAESADVDDDALPSPEPSGED